ncbi:MAG: hypothetical protein GY789_04535 [Hyphomicrobiales bacterium]|nr:hypothetical protein [Hyphomicrobiales bacterium]
MSQDKTELRILAETQHAFTGWRLKRKRGEPIPEKLWEKAFALLSRYTVTKVAGALRLNGTDLKRRATAAGVLGEDGKPGKVEVAKAKVEQEPRENRFVEMILPAEMENAKVERVGASSNGWCFKLTRADGAQLEIIPPEFNDARMHALVQGFLGG